MVVLVLVNCAHYRWFEEGRNQILASKAELAFGAETDPFDFNVCVCVTPSYNVLVGYS